MQDPQHSSLTGARAGTPSDRYRLAVEFINLKNICYNRVQFPLRLLSITYTPSTFGPSYTVLTVHPLSIPCLSPRNPAKKRRSRGTASGATHFRLSPPLSSPPLLLSRRRATAAYVTVHWIGRRIDVAFQSVSKWCDQPRPFVIPSPIPSHLPSSHLRSQQCSATPSTRQLQPRLRVAIVRNCPRQRSRRPKSRRIVSLTQTINLPTRIPL